MVLILACVSPKPETVISSWTIMIFESHESHRLRGVMVVLIYTDIRSRVATDLYISLIQGLFWACNSFDFRENETLSQRTEAPEGKLGRFLSTWSTEKQSVTVSPLAPELIGPKYFGGTYVLPAAETQGLASASAWPHHTSAATQPSPVPQGPPWQETVWPVGLNSAFNRTVVTFIKQTHNQQPNPKLVNAFYMMAYGFG